jgi:hypothetical protein
MSHLRKTVLLLFPLLFLLAGSGCSTEEIKKSENSSRIRALYDSLDRIRKVYESKNGSEFLASLSPGYPNLDQVKSRNAEIFKKYEQITLRFVVDHIVLEKTSSSLAVRWEGEWSHPNEESLKLKGNSILKFSNSESPLLIEIDGISPFSASGPDARS